MARDWHRWYYRPYSLNIDAKNQLEMAKGHAHFPQAMTLLWQVRNLMIQRDLHSFSHHQHYDDGTQIRVKGFFGQDIIWIKPGPAVPGEEVKIYPPVVVTYDGWNTAIQWKFMAGSKGGLALYESFYIDLDIPELEEDYDWRNKIAVIGLAVSELNPHVGVLFFQGPNRSFNGMKFSVTTPYKDEEDHFVTRSFTTKQGGVVHADTYYRFNFQFALQKTTLVEGDIASIVPSKTIAHGDASISGGIFGESLEPYWPDGIHAEEDHQGYSWPRMHLDGPNHSVGATALEGPYDCANIQVQSTVSYWYPLAPFGADYYGSDPVTYNIEKSNVAVSTTVVGLSPTDPTIHYGDDGYETAAKRMAIIGCHAWGESFDTIKWKIFLSVNVDVRYVWHEHSIWTAIPSTFQSHGCECGLNHNFDISEEVATRNIDGDREQFFRVPIILVAKENGTWDYEDPMGLWSKDWFFQNVGYMVPILAFDKTGYLVEHETWVGWPYRDSDFLHRKQYWLNPRWYPGRYQRVFPAYDGSNVLKEFICDMTQMLYTAYDLPDEPWVPTAATNQRWIYYSFTRKLKQLMGADYDDPIFGPRDYFGHTLCYDILVPGIVIANKEDELYDPDYWYPNRRPYCHLGGYGSSRRFALMSAPMRANQDPDHIFDCNRPILYQNGYLTDYDHWTGCAIEYLLSATHLNNTPRAYSTIDESGAATAIFKLLGFLDEERPMIGPNTSFANFGVWRNRIKLIRRQT